MQKTIVSLALVVVMAAPVLANDTKEGGFHRGVGDWTAGAWMNGGFQAKDLSDLASGSAHLVGGVNLFGAYLEAMRAEVASSPVDGAEARLRLCGFTVYHKRVPQTWNWDIHRKQDFINQTHTFWVSFIPVKVNGRIGGGYWTNTTLTVAITGAHVHGTSGIYAYGAASASIDLWFVSIGLHVDVKLFDVQPTYSLKATIGGGVQASARVDFQAIRIQLYVQVEYWWWGWHSWRHTFIDWQSGWTRWTIL